MEFKNYKALCECLSISVGTGKQKILQMKEMNRFFEWQKNGHKITITQIHSKPEESERKPRRASERNYLIEALLLNLLANRDNNEITMSANQLFEMLRMINSNYRSSKRAPLLLANYLDIETDNVNEFFEASQSFLERKLNSTLRYLQSCSLINYQQVRMICTAKVFASYNDEGDLSVNIFDHTDKYGRSQVALSTESPKISKLYRQATKKEDDYILGIEYEELKKFNVRTQQEVIKYGKWDEWHNNVLKRIRKERNIAFYYTGYEIRANQEHVEIELKELEEEQSELLGLQLNSQIHSQIMNNTIKRYKRASESILLDDRTKRRQEPAYLNDHLKIANIVIDVTTQTQIEEMQKEYNKIK